MKIVNTCNYTVEAMGGAYGIANIKDILGLIILILTVLNILINGTIKVITLIKKREYDKISGVIEDVRDELKEVEDNEKSKWYL